MTDRVVVGKKSVGRLRSEENARVGDTSHIVARVSDAGIADRRKVRQLSHREISSDRGRLGESDNFGLANSQERHCNGTQLTTIQEFHGLSRDCPIDGNRKFAGVRKDLGRHAKVEMRRCRLSDFKAGSVYIQSHFYSGRMRSVLRCCNHGRLA